MYSRLKLYFSPKQASCHPRLLGIRFLEKENFMTAQISNLFICPRCTEAMSHSTRPDKCPKCKFKFGKPDEELAKKLEWGKSPERQVFELIQQDMERFKDKPLIEIAEALGIPLTEEKREEFKEANVSNKMRHQIISDIHVAKSKAFYASTRPEDVEDLFLSIKKLMSLAVSSGNKDLVMKLGAWGRDLGRISEAIEGYVKAGGDFFERK